MTIFANKNQIPLITDYLGRYLRWKSEDCILYSVEGVDFKIHKEIFIQTDFMREILFSAKDHCCEKIEIFCPCSTEELNYLVYFLYNGEIYCDENKDATQIIQNLSKVLGFPDNLIIERKNGEAVFSDQSLSFSTQR